MFVDIEPREGWQSSEGFYRSEIFRIRHASRRVLDKRGVESVKEDPDNWLYRMFDRFGIRFMYSSVVLKERSFNEDLEFIPKEEEQVGRVSARVVEYIRVDDRWPEMEVTILGTDKNKTLEAYPVCRLVLPRDFNDPTKTVVWVAMVPYFSVPYHYLSQYEEYRKLLQRLVIEPLEKLAEKVYKAS